MAVELHIDDGAPWYESPDVWAVPGGEPEGPPGQLIAGQRAFVWARVRNRGSTGVTDALVRYYWADPSSAIRRDTAHRVGTSAVALGPGESKDVLCLTPWTPTGANGGHLCLIAEAFSPDDPLPAHLDATPFDPPGDRHVAQRNLTILLISPEMRTAFLPFLAGGRGERRPTHVVVRRMPLDDLDPRLLAQLTIKGLSEADTDIRVSLGPFSPGQPVIPFAGATARLRGHEPRHLALVVELTDPLRDGSAVLVAAEEMDDRERVLGGVALVISGSAEREREMNAEHA